MKRGLIIGVLILVVLGGVFFYSTQFKTYNLSNKLSISGNVVEYGTYESDQSYDELLEEFQRIYLDNKDKGKKTYFVFGNEKEVIVTTYEEIIQGEVNFVIGKSNNKLISINEVLSQQRLFPSNRNVEITIEGEKYNFELKPGENLYFVITENE